MIYEWDGQSVTYDSRELTNISESLEGNHAIHILVDGEEKKNNILINPDNDTIYLEITGGGTGRFCRQSMKPPADYQLWQLKLSIFRR